MLKNWGSWFGKENENGLVGGESDSSDNKLAVGENDENEQITTDETHAAPQLEQKPKSLRGKLLMEDLTKCCSRLYLTL